MFTSMYDIRVTLINKDEVTNFVKNHGEFACICYNTPSKYAKRVGESVLKSGHLSGSRGDFFKFKIEMVPRAIMDQMVRHEAGVYKNCQSLRYVNKGKFSMTYPKSILDDTELLNLWIETQESIQKCYTTTVDTLLTKGFSNEQACEVARGMLPLNINTEFHIGFNIEGLMNFMNERLCSCSQDIVRVVASKMRAEVLSVNEIYREFLVAKCDRLLYCPEDAKRCCGRYFVKSELQDIIKQGIEYKAYKEELENISK